MTMTFGVGRIGHVDTLVAMRFNHLVLTLCGGGGLAIMTMALYASAQPAKLAPPKIKINPNVVRPVSTVVNCPDTGPRQHCKAGDVCVLANPKKQLYDCVKGSSKTEKYPALGTCGLDKECKRSEYCVSGRCVLASPQTAAEATSCNGGSPCRGIGVCGRKDCSDCDIDKDGHDAVDCGGDDCDDRDGNRYPGNVEVCAGDRSNKDEDCNALTVANSTWERTASIPYWNTSSPAEAKFVDPDNDGAISSRCSNPWTEATRDPYGSMPGRKVIFDPQTRTIHGNDCRDTEAGYTSARTPTHYCEGRDVVVCGFEPGDLDYHKRLGFSQRGFMLVKQCPNGCNRENDATGRCL
jgi:hypothetical protein